MSHGVSSVSCRTAVRGTRPRRRSAASSAATEQTSARWRSLGTDDDVGARAGVVASVARVVDHLDRGLHRCARRSSPSSVTARSAASIRTTRLPAAFAIIASNGVNVAAGRDRDSGKRTAVLVQRRRTTSRRARTGRNAGSTGSPPETAPTTRQNVLQGRGLPAPAGDTPIKKPAGDSPRTAASLLKNNVSSACASARSATRSISPTARVSTTRKSSSGRPTARRILKSAVSGSSKVSWASGSGALRRPNTASGASPVTAQTCAAAPAGCRTTGR